MAPLLSATHHRPVMLLDPDSSSPFIIPCERKRIHNENQHEIETKGEKFSLARQSKTRNLCVYTFKREACAQLRRRRKFSVGNKRRKFVKEKQFSFDFCPCFSFATRRETAVVGSRFVFPNCDCETSLGAAIFGCELT